MALSNELLHLKLMHYMEKFAEEWPFERLLKLGEKPHHEYEHEDNPADPEFVQIHLQVLERATKRDEDWLHAVVDISDNRPGFGVGSAYRALTGTLCVYSDGKSEIFPPN